MSEWQLVLVSLMIVWKSGASSFCVSVEPITFHSRENCSNFVVVSFSAISSECLVICSYSDVPGVVHVHVLELDLVTVEKLFFHTLTAVC